MSARVAVLVPTLGRSPDLGEVASRLRAEVVSSAGELIWIGPAGALPAPAIGAERGIDTGGACGFARAANLGIAASGSPAIALVNDDAVVEAGWLDRLLAALDRDSRLGAVQGVQLQRGRPEICDGAGIEWSGDWRALQVGRDLAPPRVTDEPFELFGVSATAAVYRRRALEECALPGGRCFDQRLVSWYEDVELAVRLRRQGWSARCEPAARVLHRGSATGVTQPFARSRLLTRNRWLVVARLLGRRFPLALPRLLLGDLRDFARAARRGEGQAAAGIALGVLALPVALPRFAHAGAPLVAPAELARLRRLRRRLRVGSVP